MQTNSNLSCLPFYLLPTIYAKWSSSSKYGTGVHIYDEGKCYRSLVNPRRGVHPKNASNQWVYERDVAQEQDFRKWWAYGEKYPNRMPSDYLVPFFINLPEAVDPSASWNISRIEFYDICDTLITGSYASRLQSNGLVASIEDNKGSLVYFAKHTTPINLPKGMYYIVIHMSQDGDSYLFYSDVFTVGDENLVKIEWWNEENLDFEGGIVPYAWAYRNTYFKNVLYLDTTIGMPEYTFTEDGEERDGRFFPIKQISEKVYKFKAVVPEYLCDCMRLIRLSDVVTITDQLGRTYNVEHFEMDVKWLDGGHLAEIDCSFETDTVVKKVGKAYNNITDR
jgi:hypothetical protein